MQRDDSLHEESDEHLFDQTVGKADQTGQIRLTEHKLECSISVQQIWYCKQNCSQESLASEKWCNNLVLSSTTTLTDMYEAELPEVSTDVFELGVRFRIIQTGRLSWTTENEENTSDRKGNLLWSGEVESPLQALK